jgi:UDP-N-acetylglucosamine 2-epimerase (non-hydrolysing)
MTVLGTRPEAIKMALVIKALQAHPNVHSIVCATAQHRHMLDQVLGIFAIEADIDLDLMQPNQTLNGLGSNLFREMDACLTTTSPDVVLTHGDTTTAFVTSIACYHRGIAVAHVEAGLRTYDFSHPFPEEMNRRVIDLIATYLFAPTERAKQNLLSEQPLPGKIYVTGNTVVDALRYIVRRIKYDDRLKRELDRKLAFVSPDRKLVLVTGHRRESFGPGFERICRGLATIAQRGDVEIVYPVHLNPNVTNPVNQLLGRLPHVHLIPPTDYLSFVHLLSRAAVVITDSGGVQEEAVSLGKRVLVMRDVTERPEGIETGLVDLVGTDPDLICSKLDAAIEVGDDFRALEISRSTYGDGNASARIVAALAPGMPPPEPELNGLIERPVSIRERADA